MNTKLIFFTDSNFFNSSTKSNLNDLLQSFAVFNHKNQLALEKLNSNLQFYTFNPKMANIFSSNGEKIDLIHVNKYIKDKIGFISMHMIRDSISNLKFEDLTSYHGISMWKIIDNLLYEKLAYSIRLMKVIENLLEKVKPNKVIITDQTSIEGKLVVIISNKLGIKTISLNSRIIRLRNNLRRLLLSFNFRNSI